MNTIERIKKECKHIKSEHGSYYVVTDKELEKFEKEGWIKHCQLKWGKI